MRHLLILLLLMVVTSAQYAEPQAKAEQWYKADLAVIDVTLTDEQGNQTYLYVNSRGDTTWRQNGEEKKGTLKLAKDKAVAAFIVHIFSLPMEPMPATKISAHIQRRIGNDIERLIRYYPTAEDTKVLRGHIEAVAKGLR